jgi:L-aspartate oxidase
MAARAGAELTDHEFVQFHPTAVAVGDRRVDANLPLLTEALRGAGATLVDETGQRFMTSAHTLAELAPRDVVARTLEKQISAGHEVFLDLRPVIRNGKARLFPEAMEACREAGCDPATDPVPVAPAAHYHMGGIRVDDEGRSSLAGLWACGEVASTGSHGANRLASNSLLEAVVYGRRVARAIAREPANGNVGDLGRMPGKHWAAWIHVSPGCTSTMSPHRSNTCCVAARPGTCCSSVAWSARRRQDAKKAAAPIIAMIFRIRSKPGADASR